MKQSVRKPFYFHPAFIVGCLLLLIGAVGGGYYYFKKDCLTQMKDHYQTLIGTCVLCREQYNELCAKEMSSTGDQSKEEIAQKKKQITNKLAQATDAFLDYIIVHYEKINTAYNKKIQQIKKKEKVTSKDLKEYFDSNMGYLFSTLNQLNLFDFPPSKNGDQEINVSHKGENSIETFLEFPNACMPSIDQLKKKQKQLKKEGNAIPEEEDETSLVYILCKTQEPSNTMDNLGVFYFTQNILDAIEPHFLLIKQSNLNIINYRPDELVPAILLPGILDSILKPTCSPGKYALDMCFNSDKHPELNATFEKYTLQDFKKHKKQIEKMTNDKIDEVLDAMSAKN